MTTKIETVRDYRAYEWRIWCHSGEQSQMVARIPMAYGRAELTRLLRHWRAKVRAA